MTAHLILHGFRPYTGAVDPVLDAEITLLHKLLDVESTPIARLLRPGSAEGGQLVWLAHKNDWDWWPDGIGADECVETTWDLLTDAMIAAMPRDVLDLI